MPVFDFNRWGRVVIAGSLLTEFYLRAGLRETPEWQALDAANSCTFLLSFQWPVIIIYVMTP